MNLWLIQYWDFICAGFLTLLDLESVTKLNERANIGWIVGNFVGKVLFLCLDVLTEKSPCCNALHAQYQNFLERLQQTQNMWLERQLEQNHAREERLVARVLAEHTRSMEALINQLFTGLRSLLPHHQLQSNHHTAPDILNPHPHHINPTGQPAHNPTSSVPSQPEDCQ